MANKKKTTKKTKKNKSWILDLFQNPWNKWDFILVSILLATGFYAIFVINYTWQDLGNSVVQGVIWALIVSIIIDFVNKARRRAKS